MIHGVEQLHCACADLDAGQPLPCPLHKMSKLLSTIFLLQVGVWALADAGELSFLVVGDWGGQTDPLYTTPAEVALAEAMGGKAAEIGSQFTLSLGDNFYDNGVTSVDDARFNETFESIFTASSLKTPWYVVCGNHDHYGNCSAQIAYSKVSNRWKFPDYYYTQEFPIPGASSSVEILFIDTIILAGLTHSSLRAQQPSGPASLSAAQAEWDFINTTLSKWASDKNKWKIVAGHYPVWSISKHGPTEILVDTLKPMLEQAGVTAYFCGHDHNLQHLNDSGVQYYLVGAGHLIDPSTEHKHDVPKGSLQYFYGPDHHTKSKGGFATVTATDQEFRVTYFNAKGNKHYSATSYKH